MLHIPFGQVITCRGGVDMPVFLIERNFAEKLEVSPEGAASINRVNDEVGVKWLISFLSADKKKTYCLYEASNAEALREAAELNGVPADVIVEVGELSAMGMMGGVQPDRFAD